MEAHIKLGRILGIPIGLHYSWFFIALLITLSLASHFRTNHVDWTGAVIWATAIITVLLFFVTLIVHELSHAVVAKAGGLPVRSITLFALGGVARIDKEAANAKTEFWMGIVGPITSFAIGAGCLALASATGWTPGGEPDGAPLAALVWLGYINIILAAFNLIPGFPLDGGRVLRAVVWWVTGDEDRSTRIAASVGQAVAFGLIAFGLLRFFGGAGFGGLWMAFIGWFLLQAAQASYAQVAVMADVRGVRVADVMSQDCPTVDDRLTVQHFVEDHLLRGGRRCYLVSDNGHVRGLVTPHEVKQVDRARWPQVRVGEIMRPLGQLHTVTPDTPMTEVLAVMGREDVNQLPVVSDGRLEGIISRGQLLRWLQTRAELNM